MKPEAKHLVEWTLCVGSPGQQYFLSELADSQTSSKCSQLEERVLLQSFWLAFSLGLQPCSQQSQDVDASTVKMLNETYQSA